MAIPLGHFAVAAGRTLGGIGKGRLLGHQIQQDDQDKEEDRRAEMLRLSLAMQTAQHGQEDRAALSGFLTSHGAEDLADLPPGAAMSEYGRRQPGRPSASEGRVASTAAHAARVAAARGEAKGLISRRLAAASSPRGTRPKPPDANTLFQFLRAKFPDLADADLWDIVGDFTIPKKAGAAGTGTLDVNALKASLNLNE